jgi:hypothetical protein
MVCGHFGSRKSERSCAWNQPHRFPHPGWLQARLQVQLAGATVMVHTYSGAWLGGAGWALGGNRSTGQGPWNTPCMDSTLAPSHPQQQHLRMGCSLDLGGAGPSPGGWPMSCVLPPSPGCWAPPLSCWRPRSGRRSARSPARRPVPSSIADQAQGVAAPSTRGTAARHPWAPGATAAMPGIFWGGFGAT